MTTAPAPSRGDPGYTVVEVRCAELQIASAAIDVVDPLSGWDVPAATLRRLLIAIPPMLHRIAVSEAYQIYGPRDLIAAIVQRLEPEESVTCVVSASEPPLLCAQEIAMLGAHHASRDDIAHWLVQSDTAAAWLGEGRLTAARAAQMLTTNHETARQLIRRYEARPSSTPTDPEPDPPTVKTGDDSATPMPSPELQNQPKVVPRRDRLTPEASADLRDILLRLAQRGDQIPDSLTPYL